MKDRQSETAKNDEARRNAGEGAAGLSMSNADTNPNA
jgi:hypothetical protein